MTAAHKTYGQRTCPWCSNTFEATKSNQIYCQQDCTKKATNAKLIERYHANKQKPGVRECEDCGSKLSQYNKSTICNPCQLKRKDKARMETLKRLGFGYETE